jgi:glycosyltransferase involved in cell wall biosynthesis
MMGARWAGRVIVTGNGVVPSEFERGECLDHPRPYVFTAARFTRGKGLDILIRALKQLHDAGQEIDLILAGDGPEEAALRWLTATLGLERYVRFWGLASHRQVAALMNGCALFVLPSLQEAFGITCLEAMVCRKAVVATRCGGIPEVVRDGETGLLVAPGDPVQLSEAISALLRDPERRAALGRRGREVALAEYSWSAVADRYLQAYALALGE